MIYKKSEDIVVLERYNVDYCKITNKSIVLLEINELGKDYNSSINIKNREKKCKWQFFTNKNTYFDYRTKNKIK